MAYSVEEGEMTDELAPGQWHLRNSWEFILLAREMGWGAGKE